MTYPQDPFSEKNDIEKPRLRTDYVMQDVEASWVKSVRKPPRYIGLIPELCILCEGCVDICPWYCIFMLTPNIVAEAGSEEIARDMKANDILFVIDDDACTRCLLCVERCPTGALTIGRLEAQKAPARAMGKVSGATS
ncbi:MAG TPA: 4Fe-4S binding protein [Actinomycetota bacterium]|jgi:formate hydrogenlyase subunit 6/NADH:ubiquinone oxidoreductase subunit I|nr:4Fe-4S binding protein [Actinomycetota bacterium]